MIKFFRLSFVAVFFLAVSFAAFAEDFYLYEGPALAVDSDGKLVTITLVIGIDDESIFSDKNPDMMLFYDKDRFIGTNMSEIKEIFSKAEEWFETAKANNVKELNKEIVTKKQFVSSRGYNAFADVKYNFLLYDKGLNYNVVIPKIEVPSSKNEYIDVYIHSLYIPSEAVRKVNSQLSGEGFEKLKKELAEKAEKRKKTSELFK